MNIKKKKIIIIASIISIVFILSIVIIVVINTTKHEHNYNQTIIEPLCETQGYTNYSCKCGDSYNDNFVDSIGHDYEHQFVWDIDGNCLFTLICKNDSKHEKQLNCEIETDIINEPSCEVDGNCIKTATISYNGLTYYDEEEFSIPKTGHSYSAEFYWYNYENCVITLTCANNNDHKYTEECTIMSGKTKIETCETEGIITYTAYIDYNGTSFSDIKEKIIEPLNHNYDVETLKIHIKPDLNNIGILNETCLNDSSHINIIEIPKLNNIDYKYKLLEATCTESGKEIYTYTYKNKDIEIEYIIDIKPHSLNDNVCESCGLLNGSEGLTYEKVSGGYIVTGIGTCKDSLVVIPEMYANEPIIGIGENAFKNYDQLSTIYFSSNIKTIGSSAFSNCDNLQSVKYKGAIRDWCNITFDGSYSTPMREAESFYILNNNEWEHITTIEVPNSIQTISNYQFLGFDNVTEIELPDTVSFVGKNIFADCIKLNTITIPFLGESTNKPDRLSYNFGDEDAIPDTLKRVTITAGTSIPDSAFSGSNLSGITITSSIKNYGKQAFSQCENVYLTYVGTIEDWCNIKFESITSNPMRYVKGFYFTTDINAPTINEISIEIPNSVTSIGNYQFMGLDNIYKFILPTSVKSIGARAFDSCTNLEEINIDNVTSIGNYAFNECTSLTSITMSKIETIDEYAFYNCDTLTTLFVSNTLKKIGDYAFNGCNIQYVYYLGTSSEWSNIEKGLSTGILTNGDVYYYSETTPTDDKQYWHYAVDGVTPIIW